MCVDAKLSYSQIRLWIKKALSRSVETPRNERRAFTVILTALLILWDKGDMYKEGARSPAPAPSNPLPRAGERVF